MTALAIAQPTASVFPGPVTELKLEVFPRPPLGKTIVHAAEDDRNAPLIRAGDIVVVEHDGKPGWYPRDGGLFLIEAVSRPFGGERHGRRDRAIVQTYTDRDGRWRTRPLNGARGGIIYCGDGPYRDEQHLADKLLGPVIGIIGSVLDGAPR